MIVASSSSSVAAIVLSLVAGCSFARVRGPLKTRAACTNDHGAPVVDTVLAGLAMYGGWLAHHADGEFSDGVRAGGTALIVTGGVYAISAATGYAHVSACREQSRLTASASGIR